MLRLLPLLVALACGTPDAKLPPTGEDTPADTPEAPEDTPADPDEPPPSIPTTAQGCAATLRASDGAYQTTGCLAPLQAVPDLRPLSDGAYQLQPGALRQIHP